jgi:hypothetical protein
LTFFYSKSLRKIKIESAAPTANRPNHKKGFLIEYGATLWALIFGLLHVAWALGWYIGLDAEMARKAFEHGWFLAYDLIARFSFGEKNENFNRYVRRFYRP